MQAKDKLTHLPITYTDALEVLACSVGLCNGGGTIQDVLDIQIPNPNADASFPNSITVNNITINIAYGFNFGLNESSDIYVADKSGNKNHGVFSTLQNYT